MNQFLRFTSIFLISCFSFAQSLEKTLPFKQTTCRLGKNKTSLLLRFDKKPTTAQNEYTGAPIVFLKGTKTHTIEPLKDDGDFSFISPKIKSKCKDTLAFPMGKDLLAIFYSKDNRPFQEIYKVVTWNSKSDKIVDTQILGPVSEIFEINDGFAFSTLIPRSDADEREVNSESGKVLVATDKDLNALKVAKIYDKKLFIEFDPHLSYEKSQWKKFFKDKAEYLNASGWDSVLKTFKNIVVYEASELKFKERALKETCIALTFRRGERFENKWRCIQENR